MIKISGNKELVANLRECIMQVARHFQAAKSKKVATNCIIDFVLIV